MTARNSNRITYLLLVAIVGIIFWIALGSCHGQSFTYSPGNTTVDTPLGSFSADAPWQELVLRSRGHPWQIEYRHLFNTKLTGSHNLTEQTEHGGVKWEKGILGSEVRFTGHTLSLSYAPPMQYQPGPLSIGVGWQWLHGGQVLSGTDSEKKWREVDLTERKSSAIATFQLQSPLLPMGMSPSPSYVGQPFTTVSAQYRYGQNISQFSGGFRIWTQSLDLRLGYLWNRIKINDISIRHQGPYVEVGVVW